jgi:ABC-type Zn uptake system ZnuABC Zn-binding protein ZnuA
MKKYFILGIVTVLLIGVWVFRGSLFPAESDSGEARKIRITTTSESLRDIAQGVGGEYVEVVVVTEQDTDKINASEVFMYIGDGSDTWGGNLAPDLASRSIVPIKAVAGNVDTKNGLSAEVRKQLASRLVHLFSVLNEKKAGAYATNAERYVTTLK